MSLTLKVITLKGQSPHEPLSATFDQKGGSIGRSHKNDLVLPDPDRFLSRNHAVIIYDDGYHYEDTSLSGSYIRNRKIHVHQNRVKLEDGDRIEIGEYELVVDLGELDNTECVSQVDTSPNPDSLDISLDEVLSSIIPSIYNDALDDNSNEVEDDRKNEDKADKSEDLEKGETHDILDEAEKVIDEKMKEINVNRDQKQKSGDLEPVQITDILPEDNPGLTGLFNAWHLSNLDEEELGSEKKTPPDEPDEPDKHNEPDAEDDPFDWHEVQDHQSQLPEIIEQTDSTPPVLPSANKTLFDNRVPASPQLEDANNLDIKKLLATVNDFMEKVSDLMPAKKEQEVSAESGVEAQETPEKYSELFPKPESRSHSNKGAYLPNQSQAELFEIFLNAAGIGNNGFYKNEDIPDLLQTAGEIFRALVEGLLSLISGRAESKKQLRMQGTILGPIDNNPIKFSANIEDTIKKLLVGNQDGYMDGALAVRKSHADIAGHQLAMTAGIQAALKKALERFNPEVYEERYQKSFLYIRKTKCWDAYCQEYPELVIKTLENLMDDEFVRVYEEQIIKMGRLKNGI